MSKRLRVGSDCAGMATELFALQALGIEYEHAFCSALLCSTPGRVQTRRSCNACNGVPIGRGFCGGFLFGLLESCLGFDLFF